MFKTKKAEEYQLKGGGALNPLAAKTMPAKSHELFKSEVVAEKKPITKKALPPVIKPGMALPRYDEKYDEQDINEINQINIQQQELQAAQQAVAQEIYQRREADLIELKRVEKLAKIKKEEDLALLKLEQERQRKQEVAEKEVEKIAEKQRLKALFELEKKQKEEQKNLEKLALEKKQKQQTQLDNVHQSQQIQQKQKQKNAATTVKKTKINNLATKDKLETTTPSEKKELIKKHVTSVSLIRSYFMWWSIASLMIAASVIGYMYSVANQSFGESKKMTEEIKNFRIKKGESPLNALNRQEIPTTWTYWFWSRFYNIKAGRYQVKYGNSLFDLLKMMEKGKSVEEKLRFEEGKNIYDLKKYLEVNNNVEHDLTYSVDQTIIPENLIVKNILQKLNLNAEQINFWGLQTFYNPEQNKLMLHNLEGLFFPDTFFADGLITESKLLKHSFELMQSKMKNAWVAKADNLPYKTPYEALIMASIIEKESGENGERSKISGVFLNRLQKGMKLQTDPTAKYGEEVRQPNHVLNASFKMYDAVHNNDDEYNTYNISGLPPTPICLPSLESIEAALHPAKHDYLFFFASSKTGKTVFKKTLEEHNQEIQNSN